MFYIDYSGGVYALVLEEDVVGAVAGLRSYFSIDHWKKCAEVTYSTQKEGIFEVPIAVVSKSPQFKIELRGYNTTIEDISIMNASQQN